MALPPSRGLVGVRRSGIFFLLTFREYSTFRWSIVRSLTPSFFKRLASTSCTGARSRVSPGSLPSGLQLSFFDWRHLSRKGLLWPKWLILLFHHSIPKASWSWTFWISTTRWATSHGSRGRTSLTGSSSKSLSRCRKEVHGGCAHPEAAPKENARPCMQSDGGVSGVG